ncbi:TetR/AcrR family transcriptional regulator [Cellulomonas sp. C5510]|uniref:TetR/AcrR family transcriptional regulator n=1 Tax=Cellulomonas sp. C5510 TaxID=2871170 RepID=UPI001C9629F7|nr:TetR/AcrR family transcriptional regulator [Cellulomonas sp. C5510]QZN85367.1 TetR/AcrR family transcriptional regulator [Cellulomonas sp. C5510]
MATMRHQEHRPVEERREQLLEAASALARDGGLAAVTTRTVTQLAGLAHGAFHYCFASRGDLVEALLEREVLAVLQLAGDTGFAQPDPLAAIRGALEGFLRAVRSDPDRHLLLYELAVTVARHAPARASRSRAETDRAVGDLVARWSHRVRLSWAVPIDALAGAFTSAVAGLGMLWLSTRDEAAVGAAADAAALALASLCIPGPPDGAADPAAGRAADRAMDGAAA